MRLVFAAARSSPGVTTGMLACASVWPGRLLLVEAAEEGGSLAARFGLPPAPGLTTLAAAARHQPAGPELLGRHVQPLPGTAGRIGVLTAPPTVEVATPLLRTVAGKLAGLLDQVGVPVLVDAGRLGPTPTAAPLIAGADRLLAVVRPRVEELHTLACRLARLRELGPPPQLLLVGDRPYGPGEVAASLGCPVIGTLADDPAAAAALSGVGGAARLRRSRLLRSAASLVDQLTDTATSGRKSQPANAGALATTGRPASRDPAVVADAGVDGGRSRWMRA